MGKFVLTLALAAAFTACEPVPGSPPNGAGPGDGETGHAELSCRSCHSGAPIPGREPAVPVSSCTTGGCHEAGGPQEVQVATVTFPHQGHGRGGPIQPSCAGCHTHGDGEAPLTASVDACALCHVGEVTSSESQECRLCHTRPEHDRLTSQGVAVAHSELPWTEIGCVRCHYDVAEAETEVTGAECRACHADLQALNEAAVGRDMHPLHEGVGCTTCHIEDMHEVQAMSSAVDLVCADCHRSSHGVGVGRQARRAALCVGCHEGVHAAQQRLLLGIRPDGQVSPSEKFIAGITCRSCHVASGPGVGAAAGASEPIRGQATACASCHDREYMQVLDWWLDGVKGRLGTAGSYLAGAERAVPAGADSARALLGRARALLSLVAEAGGQHNLELSDRLMRDAVSLAQRAYGEAGVTAPPRPDLGRVPHTGMCSYCHYGPDEPWDFRTMPDDFHRAVLRGDSSPGE